MPLQLSIEQLQSQLSDFAQERNWEQFHNPKNLVMALSGEMGELCELFQWLTPEEARELADGKMRNALEEELADLFLYLLRLADVTRVDILDACERKMRKNAQNYPVEKSYGRRTKYTQL